MTNRPVPSEQWPAQEAQARAIVAQLTTLNPRWSLFDASGTPDEWHSWRIRRASDQLTIAIDWPEGKLRGTYPRVTASLVWPIDHQGQTCTIRTPYGEPEPTTRITVDAGRSADQIARAILTRLIAKDGERLHQKAIERIAILAEHTRAQDIAIARLIAASPGAHVSRNGGPHTVFLGAQSHAYQLRVDGGDSVRFEAFSCPVDVALRLLAALTKEGGAE